MMVEGSDGWSSAAVMSLTFLTAVVEQVFSLVLGLTPPTVSYEMEQLIFSPVNETQFAALKGGA